MTTGAANRKNTGSNENPTNPVGAVMVVGGGIAGMQSSLDLADQGYKVFLVEEKSAIGGHMAQLDKTFPTNDCAMCNISPKLVDTGRHLNIEILTNTDVMKVDGEAGDFKVTLRHRPRYIDEEICVGCGDCVDVCPISVTDLYEEGLVNRKAVFRLYSQAVPSAYAIEKRGVAPCRDACPADQRAQGYIALIAEGRYREAFRVIKEDNPFPSVCGRTCHHPCEGHCSRAMVDEPVGIMALKRFVMDYALAYGRENVEPVPRTRAEWIAVVGAGPAGLTAAHDLVKKGYGVTVYEALPVAGGMMRVGIPAHRLPKGVLQQDIDDILALGVVLKTNTPIKDPTVLLEEGYSAVCLATGISSDDHSLGIEGEDADGFISAATFLRKINLGESVHIGKRVAVVGGGITALDAAAVSRRLGADQVFLILDRPRGELPAYHWEIASVESEGIQLIERTTPTRFCVEGGVVIAIELAETGKGMVKDSHGRRRTKTIPGSEYVLEVDTVIGTVGQFSDLNYLNPRFHDMSVDKQTLASDIPGLFVVGGRKTGASYIIEAVRLGHEVSRSIHNYLQDSSIDILKREKPPVVKFTRHELEQRVAEGEIKLQPKIQSELLPLQERVTSFREVVLGLTEQQAREEAQRCLQCGVCSECLACEYVCGVNAVNHDMVTSEEQVNVGALILAPGFTAYNAADAEEYGVGRYPNVVTSLQFERLLSASGPTNGHVYRPSDNTIPDRIAFLQCVGSRDQDHDYCSSVCCMYATKEAVIAKEHHPEIDVHIFLMDVRAFSKGYLEYFKRAQEKYGIQYHYCRISALYEQPENKDLTLVGVDELGERLDEEFGMIVLSIGMEISRSARELGKRIGVDLDYHGFCITDLFNPVQTTRKGVFVAGPFKEPKDIPESIVESSGAAASSARCLAASRFTETKEREYPEEKDIYGKSIRIGVFVCHCGSNIGGFLDVPEVATYAKTLPDVKHSENLLYACSQDAIDQIINRTLELELNRVVVASCSPLTHAALFQDSIRTAGLNPYLFEMANIRNQCSWIHSDDRSGATKKAKDLVRMAVARARLLDPQKTVEIKVEQAALIVGGGAAGMTAALELAEQGFPVHLVEREDSLGGNLRTMLGTIPTISTDFSPNPEEYLDTLINNIRDHPYITVYLNSEISSSTGFKGNFNSQLIDSNGHSIEISHGVTILATGGKEYRGTEYGYGSHNRIITQQQFGLLLNGSPHPRPDHEAVALEEINSIVMIQCVGPAENYCSRICCIVALKNAIALKREKPHVQVTILYRDIRAYGFKERLYAEARRLNIVFLRYDERTQPDVKISKGKIIVHTRDNVLQRDVAFTPDYLVLSMPVVPDESIEQVSSIFKVPLDNNGFFQEAHVKLRPVDFSTDGIFMAGMGHYPKLLDESVIQTKAAASRAGIILCKETLTAGGRIAIVDPGLCTGCLTCVRICPFNVPQIHPDVEGVGEIAGAAYIEGAICQGCGSCVSLCPARAIELRHYSDAQMELKLSALTQPESIRIKIEEPQRL